MAKKKTVAQQAVKRGELRPLSHPDVKQGPKRAYLSTAVDDATLSDTRFTQWDYVLLPAVVALSLIIGLRDISRPPVVLFDEVHTIRHINKYIDGVYFTGLTPPLSHLIYTFVAYLAGYRGDAVIPKTLMDYTVTTFPYVALRTFTAVIGAFNVLLMHLTLRSCSVRAPIAAIVSALLALENLVIINERMFVPDTLFLLGVALSVFAYKSFDLSNPFSKQWFKSLVLTGIGLGLTISTKWIGLATIGWVLSLTVIKLWLILGDVQVSNCKVTKHFAYRALSFIVIPFTIYFGTFVVHFKLLGQYHQDASILSTHFQRDLIGNDLTDTPKYVTWGSTITMRHVESLGGYLHSHDYKYKSGSHNQQVTVYNFKEFNNEWIIEPVNKREDADPRITRDSEAYLRHKNTGAVLRVDNFKPPISEQEYDSEVSCFGNFSYPGNETDIFKIRFDESEKYLKSTDMTFWLFNNKKRCTVLSHELKLPSWGFNQQEVICIESPTMSRAKFIIEDIKYPQDLDVSAFPDLSDKLQLQSPSLLAKFVELNVKMYRLLKSIKVSTEKANEPFTWPFLLKGSHLATRQHSVIYIIGNPVSFFSTVVFLPVALIVSLVSFIRADYTKALLRYRAHALTFVVGWALHYLPYITVEGEYFMQYYAPALYFGLLLSGVTFEFLHARTKYMGIALAVGALALSVHFYLDVLEPLTYGYSWTPAECEAAKLFPSWDFPCSAYSIDVKL